LIQTAVGHVQRKLSVLILSVVERLDAVGIVYGKFGIVRLPMLVPLGLPREIATTYYLNILINNAIDDG
jgi:hypothetical protein